MISHHSRYSRVASLKIDEKFDSKLFEKNARF